MKKKTLNLIAGIILIIGVGILLYPSTAQWFDQKRNQDALAKLQETVEQAGSTERLTILETAKNYNEDIYLNRHQEKYDYESLLKWGNSDVMGRLLIPSIDLDQSIRHGVEETVLKQGLGHVEGTSLPIPGPNTNTVIGGHRGLATAVGFTYLDRVEVGDYFYIETAGEIYPYKIISYEIIDPGQAEVQPIIPGKSYITLITCTPIGLNTDRIVVIGEYFPEVDTKPQAGEPSSLPRTPWWAVIFVSTIGSVFVTVFLLNRKL